MRPKVGYSSLSYAQKCRKDHNGQGAWERLKRGLGAGHLGLGVCSVTHTSSVGSGKSLPLTPRRELEMAVRTRPVAVKMN